MIRPILNPETYQVVDDIVRIGCRAGVDAQQESRNQDVPNVYRVHGVIYFELPDGTLSLHDTFLSKP